jgi:hypothetical protein
MKFQSTIRRAITCLAVLTVPLWLEPLACWLAYRSSAVLSNVGQCLLFFEVLFAPVALFALAVIVVGPVFILLPKYRTRAVEAVGIAIVFLACFVGSLILGQEVWLDQIKNVVEQGEPLASAINEFATRNGHPPDSLDELVPQYIAAIPSTGVGANPEFQYMVGKQDQFDGNPWVLRATPPGLTFGFDCLMYFPLQNYPATGYGGSLERIGKWGYVHE